MSENNVIRVEKRNGSFEPLKLEKIHAILEKACEGITGVSVSDIAMKAGLSFFDGITSKQIHDTLIKAAADSISENSVNYQYVAGRLVNYDIRKTAWGGMEPPRLYDHVKHMTENGYYHPDVITSYSEVEWDKINDMIDHDRDFNMTYIGIKEYITKYSMRNRSLSDIVPLETPQLTYILAAAVTASVDGIDLKLVKSLYNDFSNWDISLPTPIMAGLRSTTKQFSSCTLIASDDTLQSISATSDAIMKYASKKAGIGVDGSRIRAEGTPVGKDKAVSHTGVIPFFRAWEGSLKSCSQGGIRGASATITACIWHLDVESLLVLKNNKGTPDSRVRKVDYSFQINDYLYNRAIQRKPITLFSPSDVPGLYDAFFSDKEKFIQLYEQYEQDPSIRKKVINDGMELLHTLAMERKETARIYVFNVDRVNEHSNFKDAVTMSNLCQEIVLKTVPMDTIETKIYSDITEYEFLDLAQNEYIKNIKLLNKENGMYTVKVDEDISEIALCTLAAINLGNVRSLDSLESICKNTVKTLDNLLDYQDYMHPAAKRSTINYRPLGIGITNLAYYLAKNGVKYNDPEGFKLVHDTMEAISFYCIKASIEIAKEKGPMKAYNKTRWSDGIMPIDHYHKKVDDIIQNNLNMDWEWLREELKKYGIRNATLLAMMPAESSSKIFNSTNGVEPVRSLISVKGNKHHISKQVVPEYMRLKNKYDMLWDMKDMDGIIKMMAVIQKFTCQSISTNLSYNPANYENGEMPASVLIGDILKANYYGLKTLYYHNTRDGREDELVEEKKEDVIESQDDSNVIEEPCESCSI